MAGSGRTHAIVGYRGQPNLPGVRGGAGPARARCRAVRERSLSARHPHRVSAAHHKLPGLSSGGSMSLLAEMNQKALGLGIPISVHLDITYRCNERCVHCYVDHDDHGEMTTTEIEDVLTQLSYAVFCLINLSGEEYLTRVAFS